MPDADETPVNLLAKEIVQVPIDAIRPHPANPNRGDPNAIGESVDTIGGFYQVVFVQRSTGLILAGEHRWRTLIEKGSPVAPVVYLDVDDDAAERILLGDNEIPRRHSHADDRGLSDVLRRLASSDRGLAGTGFDDRGLHDLLERIKVEPTTAEPGRDWDGQTIEPPADPITRPGDIWTLGRHRLICGDSRDPEVVARLLDGARANLAFTSPPYADRRKYDEASGFVPIPPEQYVDWFAPVAENVRENLSGDGSWFVNIKPSVTPDGLDAELYVFDLVLAHVREWGWHFATEFCWERNGVPKQVTQRFKNQFEPIYQFALGRWKMRPEAVQVASDNVPQPMGHGVGATTWSGHQGRVEHGAAGNIGFGSRAPGDIPGRPGMQRGPIENFQGGGEGPYGQSMVAPGMAYPGNRLPTFSGSHESWGHAAAFPVGLPAWFMRAYTDENDRVYDPFAGSGSTLIAAEQQRRRGYAAEISPGYVDVCCTRYQQVTGDKPTRDGEPFDFAGPT